MSADAGPEWRRCHRALGYDFELISDDPGFARRASPAFASLAAADSATSRYRVRPTGDGRMDVTHDDRPLASVHTVEQALGWVMWHVNQAAVASASGRCVVLHAAAARLADGVVALAGEAGAGKSTLVAALVRSGAGYVTDEALALDRTAWQVVPYPKPLSLHPGSWSVLQGTAASPGGADPLLVAPELLGTAESAPVTAPRLVVFVRHRCGATAVPRPVGRAAAVFRLAGLTFHLTDDVRGSLAALTRLVCAARCCELPVDDLDQARAAIVTELAASPSTVPATTAVERIAAGVDDHLVWTEVDDEVVVYVTARGTLHHLDPVATAAWRALRQRHTRGEVVDDLRTRFAAPRGRIEADVADLAARFTRDGLCPSC